jgi:hypothetical protein
VKGDAFQPGGGREPVEALSDGIRMWRALSNAASSAPTISGLKWPDVNLDTGEITIHDNRVVLAGYARDKAGGKTRNADKTIAIDRATVAALRGWRAQQDPTAGKLAQMMSRANVHKFVHKRHETAPGEISGGRFTW